MAGVVGSGEGERQTVKFPAVETASLIHQTRLRGFKLSGKPADIINPESAQADFVAGSGEFIRPE
jgi:hypothetical protein